MSCGPISPFVINGFNKYLSMHAHQLISYAIYTFAELGIADKLIHADSNRGLTVDEIIGENEKQWNKDLLYRILRACIYGDIVKHINDDKHFILTSSGMMITSDHPSHIRDHIRFTFGPICTGSILQLPNIVRGDGIGTGVARISNGLDFYTLINQPDQKEFLSVFSGAMTAISNQSNPKLVSGIDFSRFKTIVDIGGNRGTFLSKILQNYPTIEHGIVFDLPEVINQNKNGEDFLLNEIDKKRWSFIEGDVFDSSTIPLADAYILKYVLHDFNDEKSLQILSSIRKANENKKNSSLITIFLVELVILPYDVITNWQSHAVDMAMATLFENSRERTEDEYKQLLSKSGFQFTKLYPIQAPESVIEATLINN